MRYTGPVAALVIALASPAAFATDIDFGGDVDVRGFSRDDGNDRASALDQRIRLQMAIDAGQGVEVHGRLNLLNDRLQGDDAGARGDGSDALNERPFTDSTRGNRNVELDYGYLRFPLFGGAVQVGRQVDNWNFDFTVSDDRRDRLSFIRRIGGVTMVAAYDRRQSEDQRLRALNGDQYQIALLGAPTDDVEMGLAIAAFESGAGGTGDAIDELAARRGTSPGDDDFPTAFDERGALYVAPWITARHGDFRYTLGGHRIGGGRGDAFSQQTWGGFLRGGFHFTPEFSLEGQLVYGEDGTLVAPGFDTFSSLINNSPRNDRSATTIERLNLGGFGSRAERGDEVMLLATRATYEGVAWTFQGAVGNASYDRTQGGNRVDEDVLFVDFQIAYQLAPSTEIRATAGLADTDDFNEALGEGDGTSHATSLQVHTTF